MLKSASVVNDPKNGGKAGILNVSNTENALPACNHAFQRYDVIIFYGTVIAVVQCIMRQYGQWVWETGANQNDKRFERRLGPGWCSLGNRLPKEAWGGGGCSFSS